MLKMFLKNAHPDVNDLTQASKGPGTEEEVPE